MVVAGSWGCCMGLAGRCTLRSLALLLGASFSNRPFHFALVLFEVQPQCCWNFAPSFRCILPHLTRPQDYGNPVRSGKLVVLAKVLQHWKAQGHK